MKEGNILELINTDRFYYLTKTLKNNFYHIRRPTRSIDEIYSDPKLLFCCLYCDHDNKFFYKSDYYHFIRSTEIVDIFKTEINERMKHFGTR